MLFEAAQTKEPYYLYYAVQQNRFYHFTIQSLRCFWIFKQLAQTEAEINNKCFSAHCACRESDKQDF